MAAPAYFQCIVSTTTTQVRTYKQVYHPLFSNPDTDVVIRSLEGTLYRVHSYTLRTTSGLFETMFNLPQPQTLKRINVSHSSGSQGRNSDIALEEIPLYESDLVVERILCMLCGQPVAKWESFDEVERVLAVAEKWDTPGPIATIRSALTSPKFLAEDPLRLYALAKHFGWMEEAKLASTHTLTMCLHNPCHAARLAQLSSKDLLPLLNLHRRRRDYFKELIDSPERFTAGNSSPYHCSRCGITQLDNHTWRELKNAMFLEMDRRPLGDTLGYMVGAMSEWPEAKACWEAQCRKEGCGGLNYDRVATLRQIRNCVELLPLSIEE